METDHSKMKLGKRAARHDSRTLALSRYLLPTLAPPPPACFWSLMLPDWGEMLNDQLGCCTIAGVGHAVQTWTEVINQRVTVGDDQVLYYYQWWDGYRGGLGGLYDFASDQGGVELDVLNRWRKYGFSGHVLQSYAKVDHTNVEHVKPAIALLGGVYIGVGLPLAAKNQSLWDAPSATHNDPSYAPWSWGGHCVWVLAYDETTLTCVTWGKLQRMTWAFWEKYVDEAYALLSPEFIADGGKAPSGLDMVSLEADLKAVTA